MSIANHQNKWVILNSVFLVLMPNQNLSIDMQGYYSDVNLLKESLETMGQEHKSSKCSESLLLQQNNLYNISTHKSSQKL